MILKAAGRVYVIGSASKKLGIALMVVGLLAWGVPALYYRYPTQMALSIPLPLPAGASLRQVFSIRGTEHYCVYLRCKEISEFKERWKGFLNSKGHPTIPCDISLSITRRGRVIHSEHLEALEPRMCSAGMDYWHLAYLRFPSSGAYELRLTNGTDLRYLQATDPTVQVRISDWFIKNWGINTLLGFVAGSGLFLVGFTVFISGIRRIS